MRTATIGDLRLEEARDDDLRAVPCPACGSERLGVLLSAAEVESERRWLEVFHAARVRGGAASAKDRSDFTQSRATNVVRCDACGTVLRNPQPTCDAVGDAYAHDEYGTAALERLAESQTAFFRDKLARLDGDLAGLGRGSPVLEVGSFVGGFLAAARERGWDALGADVGEETTAFVRRAGFHVVRGDVADVDLPDSSLDADFVWSTFDQLCDPRRLLERAFALLREGGVLVLRVPNGRFETACLELRRRAAGTPRERRVLAALAYDNFLTFPYLTGYTPESLAGLLARNGFDCRAVHGDTLVSLAASDTLPFAVREEARIKRAVMRACDLVQRSTGVCFHPWIDVVSRRLPDQSSQPQSRSGP